MHEKKISFSAHFKYLQKLHLLCRLYHFFLFLILLLGRKMEPQKVLIVSYKKETKEFHVTDGEYERLFIWSLFI
jgi:hypothetical protein